MSNQQKTQKGSHSNVSQDVRAILLRGHVGKERCYVFLFKCTFVTLDSRQLADLAKAIQRLSTFVVQHNLSQQHLGETDFIIWAI